MSHFTQISYNGIALCDQYNSILTRNGVTLLCNCPFIRFTTILDLDILSLELLWFNYRIVLYVISNLL